MLSKIMKEAREYGINEDTIKELLKEYKKIRKTQPKNFVELIEVAVC